MWGQRKRGGEGGKIIFCNSGYKQQTGLNKKHEKSGPLSKAVQEFTNGPSSALQRVPELGHQRHRLGGPQQRQQCQCASTSEVLWTLIHAVTHT
jgi:hypothetical protein